MYLFAFMAGAAHYGLNVGRILVSDYRHKDRNIYTFKTLHSWPLYRLPKPYHITAMKNVGQTCLICLIQFVVAPHLLCIPAFNHDGSAWGHGNGGEGVLNITFRLDDLGEQLLHISSPHKMQADMRVEFVAQESLRGVHVVFADDDRVDRIPPRRLDDPRLQGEADDDEDEDHLVTQNPNWWG